MTAPPKAPSSKWSRHLISIAVALAAFGLLAFVIHRNGGLATIASIIARLGNSWPLLLLPYAINAGSTIMAYRSCLPGRGRDVPFMVLVQIERSGSALNAFLPLGDSSGNIIKIALLRHWYTSDQIVAAGVWSSLATGVGNGIAAIGPLIVYAMGILPGESVAVLSGLCLLMTVPAVTILVLVRRGLMVRAASALTRLPIRRLRARKDTIVEWARGLEHHVASAVSTRFGDFLRVVGWRACYQFVRVCEIWLVITLLDLPGGIGAALAYNAMSRVVQQVFTFVPGRMGVVEGFSAVLSSALGWPASAGVGLSLTLRFNFFVNLFVSGSALSGTHALSLKYPPRDADELRAARTASP